MKMPCRITDEHVDSPWDRPDDTRESSSKEEYKNYEELEEEEE